MNRIGRSGISAFAVLLVLVAGCGKTIPEPVVVEPESERPMPTTEGSLWPGENAKNNLFSDRKAARVGDIITVHLVERTTASNKAATKTQRNSKAGFKLSTGSTSTPTEFGLNGNNDFTGNANTSRSETLISTISTMVQEVLPNGNLRIGGQRKLKINNEDQYIKVDGIVRPEDINFDNSILSTKIANADITYDGVGDLDKAQKSGWLGKALNVIWPF